MTIERTIEGKIFEIELTEEELLEACKQHLAKANEEFIRDLVEDDEDFKDLSDEDKKALIKDSNV